MEYFNILFAVFYFWERGKILVSNCIFKNNLQSRDICHFCLSPFVNKVKRGVYMDDSSKYLGYSVPLYA